MFSDVFLLQIKRSSAYSALPRTGLVSVTATSTSAWPWRVTRRRRWAGSEQTFYKTSRPRVVTWFYLSFLNRSWTVRKSSKALPRCWRSMRVSSADWMVGFYYIFHWCSPIFPFLLRSEEHPAHHHSQSAYREVWTQTERFGGRHQPLQHAGQWRMLSQHPLQELPSSSKVSILNWFGEIVHLGSTQHQDAGDIRSAGSPGSVPGIHHQGVCKGLLRNAQLFKSIQKQRLHFIYWASEWHDA